VATDGGAPVLARHLRAELEATYGPEYGALAELLGDLRRDPSIRSRMGEMTPEQRNRAWRSIPLTDILAALRSGAPHIAKELAAACLSLPSD
jgi:siroheme synthase (precorrin-2 oxidase/ferrochelatase)